MPSSPDTATPIYGELKEAESAIQEADDEDVQRDYEKELLPALERMVNEGPLLFIVADT